MCQQIGYLHVRVLYLQMELFDTDRIRGCLEGKHIVLLGDSTMSETVHDLVLLVSGLANWPDQVDTYIYNATRYVSCPLKTLLWLYQPAHESEAAAAKCRGCLCSQQLTVMLQARQGLFRDLGPLQGHEAPSRSKGRDTSPAHRIGCQLPAAYLSP